MFTQDFATSYGTATFAAPIRSETDHDTGAVRVTYGVWINEAAHAARAAPLYSTTEAFDSDAVQTVLGGQGIDLAQLAGALLATRSPFVAD